MKHWKDVQRAIQTEMEQMWFDEPKEVTMCKLGVFPSGAGMEGQAFFNQFFLVSDTEALGYGVAENCLYEIADDESFTLAQCQKVFQFMTEGNSRVMGDKAEPGCTAPWFNMGKLWQLYQDIVESFPTMESKTDFKNMMWSWECYVNRYHFWFWNVFPWELGLSRPRVDQPYLDRLQGLL